MPIGGAVVQIRSFMRKWCQKMLTSKQSCPEMRMLKCTFVEAKVGITCMCCVSSNGGLSLAH